MILGGEVTATESAAPDESFGRGASNTSAVAAIDIVVRWGDSVLCVKELSPPRPFVVGEQDCDVTLPAVIIGAPRVPVLLARWDGDVRLIVPQSARVLLGGQTKRMSATRCITRGFGQPSTAVPHAAEVQLLPGQTATLFFQSIAIDVQLSTAAPRSPRTALVEKRVALAQLASFAVHAILLGILTFFIGPAEVDEDYGMTADQLYELQERLYRIAEKDLDLQYEREGYERRGRRNERRMQAAMAARQDEWMKAIEAGASGWTAQLEAEAMRDEAPQGSSRDLIGTLYDWPKPEPLAHPIGSPTRDNRPFTVTLPADAQPSRRRGPSIRMGATSVSGRLPPEVIQRIVRQNFGRFRLCYENGLRNNPNLQGRVGVRFVIGRDGAVSNVSNGGSDMPDGGVVSCVIRSFQGLSFPQPEGGIVTVVYPIMMSPGD